MVYINQYLQFQHLQLLRSRKCRRMALIKYILVVSATAIIFNIPKFFETQVEWKNVNDINLPNQTTTVENISRYPYIIYVSTVIAP